MEGNGYYQENDQQGYADGWGNNSRRNTSVQSGLYSNESYMQRGVYYDTSSSYGGDLGSNQRVSTSNLYGTDMGSQRISTSNMYGSDMGSQRMSYQYGQMDISESAPQRDTSYSNMTSYGLMDQNLRRTFTGDYDGSALTQNSYRQRPPAEPVVTDKRTLSNYESNQALMQGGSYAGSSPYGKDVTKRNNEEDNSATQKGNFNTLGQKGSVTYKAVAPPEVGAFAYEYEKFGSSKRYTGFKDFDSGSRNSGMFDDNRYRLGSGKPGYGGGRGRGRGSQSYVTGSDNWQNSKGQKRNDSSSQQGGSYPKKKKNPVQGLKNPVSFINEIRPDANFEVNDMEGPSNLPTFKVVLEFDGEAYSAQAKSKKLAKRYVAEAALKVYLQSAAARQLGYTESQIDFGPGPQEEVTNVGNNTVPVKKGEATTKPKPVEDVGGKNPVMHLNELKKDAVYDLKEETGQAHNKNFIMRVTVDGQSFEGSGQSKKIAKAVAAKEALKGLGLGGGTNPITEDNKGYKLLQKMGWNGTGLGANEQGRKQIIQPTMY